MECPRNSVKSLKLTKPFPFAKLAKVVRTMLDKKN
jgi:hypothetical protein